jgi:hypothetical protein
VPVEAAPSTPAGQSEPVSPGAPADPIMTDAQVAAALPEHVVLYRDFVDPMLADKCGGCHLGKDAAGSLRVGSLDELLAGGDTGAAVARGDANGSLLVERIALPISDGDHMPPDGMPQLSTGQVELLRAWIDLGAPERRPVKSASLPRAAQRVIAAHFAEKERLAEEEAPPPEVLAAQGRAGGCAACTITARRRAEGLWLPSLAVLLGPALRRSRRAVVRASTRA